MEASKPYVVTGATGIVGSHVTMHLLDSGHSVIACKRSQSSLKSLEELFLSCGKQHLLQKIEWKEADINDVYALDDVIRNAKGVFHCAGMVSFLRSDRQSLKKINTDGTLNVVSACLHANVPLCFVSSIATLNNTDVKGELTESVFWKRSGKESDYAISKYNAEREVWRAMEEGLEAVIVNPGVVLSEGFRNHSSSAIFDRIRKGLRFYTKGSTAYVAATDLAKAMVMLMEKKKFGQRYIVTEGNYSFHEILTAIAKALEVTPPKTEAGRSLLNLAGFLENVVSFVLGKNAQLSSALINSLLSESRYSNKKISIESGMQFTPIKAEIERICSKIRASGR